MNRHNIATIGPEEKGLKELQILPPYFRFVRGVMDSDDLPLNVSRESLQHNRVMMMIQQNTLKKLFSELKQLSTTNAEKYASFVALLEMHGITRINIVVFEFGRNAKTA